MRTLKDLSTWCKALVLMNGMLFSGVGALGQDRP